MNKNFDQFENYLENLNLQKNNNEIIICPSNIFLEKIYKRDLPISIGAQDVDHRVEGAATGSTSAAQINRKHMCPLCPKLCDARWRDMFWNRAG